MNYYLSVGLLMFACILTACAPSNASQLGATAITTPVDIGVPATQQVSAPTVVATVLQQTSAPTVVATATPRASAPTRVALPSDPDKIDWLMIFGSIDLQTHQVNLEPMFVIPQIQELEPLIPGDYAIVLRNMSGKELARYPFTAKKPDTIYEEGEELEPHNEAYFHATVPLVAGTDRVDIEGPEGVLISVSGGHSAPEVHITSPNGGETFDGSKVPVSWTASDADHDVLNFEVMYSPNGGLNWQLVGSTRSDLSTEVTNLIRGDKGLFRVLASDGVHTSMDESDAYFTIPNHLPEVKIRAPGNGLRISTNDTFDLSAIAHDADTWGWVDEEHIRWFSNIDGLIGTGLDYVGYGLSPGVHTITLQVDDDAGGVVTDSVQITVVENTQVPSRTVRPSRTRAPSSDATRVPSTPTPTIFFIGT